MSLENEEVLSKGEEYRPSINTKVVLMAREIIRNAEKDLCILVKDYVEKNRIRRVEVKEETLKEWRDRKFTTQFSDTIRINDWDVTLLFEAPIGDRWVYVIKCPQLGVERLSPPENSLAIQGELKYEFFCNVSDEIETTMEQTIML